MAATPLPFWTIGSRGGIHPEIEKVFQLMGKMGFRKKYNDSNEVELIKLDKPFYDNANVNDLINALREHILSPTFEEDYKIQEFPNAEQRVLPEEIWEAIMKFGTGRIFSDHNLNSLPLLEIKEAKHTIDRAFYFYENGFVDVSKKNIKLLPYQKLNGVYIKREKVIKRKFVRINTKDSDTNLKNAKAAMSLNSFLNRISKSEKITDSGQIIVYDDDKKLKYLRQLIGYCLHDFKMKGKTDFAPYFCDDEGGGSGKGIIIQILEQFTAVAQVNGKKDERFDPLNLTEKTRVKVYSDVKEGFSLQETYNEITEWGYIRKMHKDPIVLKYEESYKVAFTGNFLMKGIKSSDKRRLRVYDIHIYFNEKHTPEKEYGCTFMNQTWDNANWNFFDNMVMEIVQDWLKCDYNVYYYNERYENAQIDGTFPGEFRDFMNDTEKVPRNEWTATGKLFETFKQMADDGKYKGSKFIKNLSANSFGRMLTNFLKATGQEFQRNASRTEITIKEATK
jgi:hypothetical protein